MLNRAKVAAIARASFFMGAPVSHDAASLRPVTSATSSAEKTHSHEICRNVTRIAGPTSTSRANQLSFDCPVWGFRGEWGRDGLSPYMATERGRRCAASTFCGCSFHALASLRSGPYFGAVANAMSALDLALRISTAKGPAEAIELWFVISSEAIRDVHRTRNNVWTSGKTVYRQKRENSATKC
jgi:hypothetical protein